MAGLHLVLAGAAIGNGNRGVEALGWSVVDSVDRNSPGALLTVLDDGWGVRTAVPRRYERIRVEYVGVRRSRRWHRPESWAQVRVAQTLRLHNNPVAVRFSGADAVLDLSAGDSFTDLYGHARLATVLEPKRAALRAKRPLVLLPQTYGPFSTRSGRRSAERVVRSASLAYARDPLSYQRLLELAGPDADRSRLHTGVDVAFALEARRPDREVVEQLEALSTESGVVAGVNVSGLLRDAAGRARFGLAGDYIDTMSEVVRGLLSADAHVVFVPHVHEPQGAGESDVRAVADIMDRLEQEQRTRTTVLPVRLDAAELKWCIAQMDWFVGSRMHSTIAALSTATPAAAYAYSDKTFGVFQTCAMGDEVVDARRTSGREAAEAILSSFERRETSRAQLTQNAPATVDASARQLREVIAAVTQWHYGTRRAEAIA